MSPVTVAANRYIVGCMVGESDTRQSSIRCLNLMTGRHGWIGWGQSGRQCWRGAGGGGRISWVADLVVTLLEVSTGESIMQFGVTLRDIVRVC